MTPKTVLAQRRAALAVMNPSDAMTERMGGVLFGSTYGERRDWEVMGSPAPDGSYALLRIDDDSVEVLSDAAGSRTVWVYKDEEKFICATSQRAVLMLIGGVEFDARVLPWILTTGTLGPVHGWDRRVERLPADSILTLNRTAWTTRLSIRPPKFSVVSRSNAEHRDALADAVEAVFKSRWSYAPASLVLPLSGGYDSRTILCLLLRAGRANRDVDTVTWGLAERQFTPQSDAQVAAEVASALKVKNRYLALDGAEVDAETVLSRFVAAAEGRVDHISGYVDGMALWNRLNHEGVQAVVRGDEGFGWIPATTERAVRYSVGMGLAADYPNVSSLLQRHGIPPNELPDNYHRRDGETVATWRDRMYHTFRLPTVLAALSDIKLSYVEVLNPLLARSILEVVRTLPDELRTRKLLFRQMADGLGPPIGYANSAAISSSGALLVRNDFQQLMRQLLLDATTSVPLQREFLSDVANQLSPKPPAASAAGGNRKSWRTLIPQRLRNRMRDFKPMNVDQNQLALRVCILVSIFCLFDSDKQWMVRK